jgi:hypothetical protein
VTQGTRGRPAGIDPPPERDDERGQVGRRLAIELYVVHEDPLGSGLPRRRPLRRVPFQEAQESFADPGCLLLLQPLGSGDRSVIVVP